MSQSSPLEVRRIFLSSPSDVIHERNKAAHIIEEFNSQWGAYFRLRFEVIRWESEVMPSIGADVQAVINAQVNSEYDLFVGLMWSRIGTPTERAQSGTVEEFQAALRRNKTTGSTPHIMFYFKTAPVRIDTDPGQLTGVQMFKEEMAGLGLLFGSYRSISEFEAQFRRNFVQYVQRMVIANAPVRSTGGQYVSYYAEIASRINDPRVQLALLIDYATGRLYAIAKVQKKPTDIMNSFGKKLGRATARAKTPEHLPGLIEVCISSLNAVSNSLDETVPVLHLLFIEGFDSAAQAVLITLKNQIVDESIPGIIPTLRVLLGAMSEAAASIANASSIFQQDLLSLQQYDESAALLMAQGRFGKSSDRYHDVIGIGQLLCANLIDICSQYGRGEANLDKG